MDANIKTKRYKNLFSDTIAFAVSNFASKILVFLLVPLYTSVLSTNDYGIADLVTNTVNLLYPILTLSIMEATLRYSFDSNIAKDEVLLNSLIVIIIAEGVLICITPITKSYIGELQEYWIWLLIIFFGFNLQQVLSQFVKGIGNTKIFAKSGIVQTLVVVISNIIGLLILNGGLKAYLLSIALGYYITVCYLIFASKIKLKKFTLNPGLFKEMVLYSIPMIPTLVSWWVSTSADKYVIIAYLGIAASGIYSVAYKIPSVLNLLTNIFTSAWMISAIQSISDEDSEVYQSNVYKYFNAVNVLVCTILIIFSQILGKILFAKEFYEAWHCVPFLLVAYVFAGLSGFLASSFRAEKNTKGLVGSSLAGGITNIILNIVCIPFLGIMGAAFTTLIGFAVTFFLRLISLKKIMNINVESKKNNFSYFVLVIQAFVMGNEFRGHYIISCVLLVLIICIYIDVYRVIVGKLVSLLKNRKRF